MNNIKIIGLAIITIFTSLSYADDKPRDYDALLKEAAAHLKGFSAHAQSEAVINLAGASKSVIIIPDEYAASLIVGYKRGTGAMFRRHGDEWSDPVFMTFSHYSVGLQAGGAHNEVMVMILTHKVADGLIDGVSNIGGSGGFALGDLGMGSTAGGSLGGGLEMFSISTQKGLMLGGSIDNTHVKAADDFNRAAWGDDYDMKEILSKPGGKLESATELREALAKATKTSYGD
jgi:lipid-binding SYLF domain-containing protein